MTRHLNTELKYQLKQIWRRWAKPLIQCSVALLISVGSLWLFLRPEGTQLGHWVLGHFFEFRGPRTVPSELVIVALDDVTYQQLGASPRWPFPRKFMAEALERIVRSSPKTLILDAGIPKEDNDPAANARIEKALSESPSAIWDGTMPTNSKGLVVSDPMGVYQFRSDERFLKAAKVTLPLTFPRTEGIISRLAVSTDPAASLFERAPLSRALVQLAKLPIASPGPFDMINYYGPAGTIDRFSLSDLVLKDLEFATTRLKDKIVFVGYQNTLRGRVPGADLQQDEYRVSASDEPMFGVEIHAHVAGNLMDGSWLKRLPPVKEVSCLYVASLIIAVLGIALSPEKAIIAIAVLISTAIGAAYWAFAYRQFVFPSVGALVVAGLVTAVGSALFHYLNIKGFKKYIRRTFNFEMDREL